MSDEQNANADKPNRRHFSRVEFSHEVTLKSEQGVAMHGAFSDISLKGMLFQGESLPQVGDKVSGALVLGESSLNISGEVVASNKERGAGSGDSFLRHGYRIFHQPQDSPVPQSWQSRHHRPGVFRLPVKPGIAVTPSRKQPRHLQANW